MKYLCENIQGCVLGYTQSDEITLVLVDSRKHNSSAWFDNEVQKVCSVSAALATYAFNKYFKENASAWIEKQVNDPDRHKMARDDPEEFKKINKLIEVYDKATTQKRGSCCIKADYFGDKRIHLVSTQEEGDYYWDDDGNEYPSWEITFSTKWWIDNDIPVFKDEGRKYIEKLINVGE